MSPEHEQGKQETTSGAVDYYPPSHICRQEFLAAAAGASAFHQLETKEREQGPLSREAAQSLLARLSAAKVDRIFQEEGNLEEKTTASEHDRIDDMWNARAVKENARRKSIELYEKECTNGNCENDAEGGHRRHHYRQRASMSENDS